MEKQIKITPSLFSLKNTKKINEKKNSNKGKSKKNINAFLKRIKEHAKNKTIKNKLNDIDNSEELNINSHIEYLEQLKQNQKKKQSRKKKYQVNIELDNKLEPQSDVKMLENNNNRLQEVNINDLLDKQDKVSTKLDSLPVKTDISSVKIHTLPVKTDTEPAKTNTLPAKTDTLSTKMMEDIPSERINNIVYKPGPEKPWGNLKNGPKPTYREWKNKTQKNNTAKPYIKKHVKKYKYTLGKKDGKISVLLKNNKTRKAIQEDKRRLESATLIEVKDYLKKHFLYKSGSSAPPELLREIYRSAHLAGAPVTNVSKENLINNFYKLD